MFSLFQSVSQRVLIVSIIFVSLNIWSSTVWAVNSITVKSGQSIIKIMRQVYPDQRSRWPSLMRELVKANPAAFENGDPRTLKVGSVLSLPEKSTAKVKELKRTRAASIKSFSGSVTLFDDKKKASEVKSGTNIYVGDQLLTSATGSATLSFIDGAIVKLRCNSLLNISQYKMRTQGSQSELMLLKGSLHNETGRIGKRSNDTVILKTPVANISANQAEYGVRVHQSQACEKQADVENDGLFVAVLNGSVITESDGGKLEVSSGDALMVAQRGLAPLPKQAFSGMVFGDRVVKQSVIVKSPSIIKVKEKEPVAEVDNGIPVWWMIAASVILGITF